MATNDRMKGDDLQIGYAGVGHMTLVLTFLGGRLVIETFNVCSRASKIEACIPTDNEGLRIPEHELMALLLRVKPI